MTRHLSILGPIVMQWAGGFGFQSPVNFETAKSKATQRLSEKVKRHRHGPSMFCPISFEPLVGWLLVSKMCTVCRKWLECRSVNRAEAGPPSWEHNFLQPKNSPVQPEPPLLHHLARRSELAPGPSGPSLRGRHAVLRVNCTNGTTFCGSIFSRFLKQKLPSPPPHPPKILSPTSLPSPAVSSLRLTGHVFSDVRAPCVQRQKQLGTAVNAHDVDLGYVDQLSQLQHQGYIIYIYIFIWEYLASKIWLYGDVHHQTWGYTRSTVWGY